MKKVLIITSIILLLFVSCKGKQEETVSLTPAKTTYVPKGYSNEEYAEICGTQVLLRDGYVVEPDSKLDIFNMSFEDFGSFFTQTYPVTVTEYDIAVGEPTQTTVYHIHSENPGKTVYISGGIHGNEVAAWYAGVLMKNATIKSGDLYVLSRANIVGAKNNSRSADSSDDPNRFFPGDPDGTVTERLDWAIYSDIEDKQPDLLLDLHEAILYTDSRDFLGSTYIFTDLAGIEELFFDLLCATSDKEICHNEFGFTGPGPIGSMNNTVTTSLKVPSITVETFRGFDIYRRVYDQLDTIQYILKYYDMI